MGLGDHVRRLWRAWARIFWKVAGKMREVRPRWQQVAPKMGHDGVKMAILVSTLAALGLLDVIWMILWGLGEHFGGVLAHGWDSKSLNFP